MGSTMQATVMLALLFIGFPCLTVEAFSPLPPPPLLPVPSFLVDSSIDSALSSANAALKVLGLEPLQLPEIRVPLQLLFISGEMVLTKGFLNGLTTLVRKKESKVLVGFGTLEASSSVGLGPLVSRFDGVSVSGLGLNIRAPDILVSVVELGAQVGLSLGLGASGPAVNLVWDPPLEEMQVGVKLDLPPILEPINWFIMSSIMIPVRERVREVVATTVTQEVEKALGALG